MKLQTLPLIVFFSTIALSGCGAKQTVLAEQPKKLSDAYATSALLALKAIQRDVFVPPKNSNLVGRATQEKIDAADVAAASPEERNLTAVLNSVYHEQLTVNQRQNSLTEMSREVLALDATRYTQKQWNALTEAEFKILKLETPKIKAVRKQLDSCFADFDASLRARSTTAPESCTTEK
jgi:hypothetical protein